MKRKHDLKDLSQKKIQNLLMKSDEMADVFLNLATCIFYFYYEPKNIDLGVKS